MSERTDKGDIELLRQKIIGLGERSISKSYYPELRRRLDQLEAQKKDLEEERRKARESEASYRNVIENIQDVFYRSDAQGNLIMASPSIVALLGYESLDECLGRPIAGAFYYNPEKRTEFLRRIQKTGSVMNYEVVLKRRDGIPVIVETSSHLYFDDAGNFAGVEGTFHDITERNRAEMAQQQNSERIATLLRLNQMTEATVQEIMEFAFEEAITLTKSKIGFLGIMNEDETVMTVHVWSSSVMPECNVTNGTLEFPLTNAGLWAEAVRQRRPIVTNDYNAPNSLKKGIPEGHVRLLRHMNIPIFDGHRIVLLAGVGNKEEDYDETDVQQLMLLMEGMWRLIQRKQTEDAIREKQRFLGTLISNLDGMVYRCKNDSDWTMEFVSEGSLLLTGYTPKQLSGSQTIAYGDLIHPEDREMVWDMVQAGVKAKQSYRMEYRIIDVNGAEKWVWEQGTGIYSEMGDLLVLEGFITDITDRKHTEEELKRHRDHLEELVQERTTELAAAKEAAETANRAKSDFLARMSHDLRTPLNAIMGYAQILKRQENLPDKQRDQLNTIQESGEHLLALINDILDLSRIEARKEEIQREAFNLPALIHEVLSATGVKATEKHLSFLYEENESLPALVRGDARKLRQVLMNLLDNAVKYTQEGSVTLKVASCELRVANSGLREEEPFQYPVSSITFHVSDTGIGIPQEQIEAIFEPFMQGDVQATEGIGLGLAISRHLVELMGGKLSVESTPEKGSAFAFTLELEVVEEGAVTPEEHGKAIIGYHGEPKRILIADDNPTNLAMLVSVLEPLGFIVETTKNGEETFIRAALTKPDLILMDLLMPVTNGHDALRRIRGDKNLTHMKVVGVSAAVADKERTEEFVADCDGFIAKPVYIKTLLEEIKEQLGIEWIKGKEPVSLTEEPVTMPPDDVLMEMLLIAEGGDYTTLEHILSTLTDDMYAAFCRRIRSYAKTYDDEGIINYIKKAHNG